jgi:hypothetical protein
MGKEKLILIAIAAVMLVSVLIPTAMADPIDITSKINNLVDRIFDTIENIVGHFAARAMNTGIFIARAIYLTLIILGIVLRYTGISSFGGRNMIVGGLVLALLSELIASTP